MEYVLNMSKTKKEFYVQDYERHKDKYLARATKRRQDNPELVAKEKRAWYEKFKLTPAYKEYRKKNKAKRRSTVHGKLHDNFSCLMRLAVRNKAGRNWETLVGYTTENLKTHLEAQFTDGMSWENYGKWHIDHIKPVCSFKYESFDSIEFQECWSLINLRPLWALDNIRKGAKDRLLKIA